jgi:polar amino acid transport system substrate-binding protein
MKYAKPFFCLLAGLCLMVFTACAPMETREGALSKISPVINYILERGELRVGTTGAQPPFNMTNRDGEIIGFEADLARYLADAMGVSLKMVPMPFADLLPSLEAGEVDMILSDMTITAKRNLKTVFVGPYFISGKSVLTKKKNISGIKDFSSINTPQTIITVLRGSTSQIFVEKVLPGVTLVPVDNYDDGVHMVLTDEAHAMFADYPFCIVALFQYPKQGLITNIRPLTYEPIGIVLPAGDHHLVNWVENFLEVLKGSGELDNLNKKWFEDDSWLLGL